MKYKGVVQALSLLIMCGVLGLGKAAVANEAQVVTLTWEDLIPAEDRNMPPPPRKLAINHESDDTPAQLAGRIRPELDGQRVRMPGFVIPLEGDDKVVTEMLLVPYFGACIHVPPPPPNQIVYTKFKQGAPVQNLWDVVYVTGTLRTQTVDNDLGQSGYLLEGISVESYKEN